MQRKQIVRLLLLCAFLVLPGLAWAQDGTQTLVIQLGPNVGQNQGVIWQAEADWQFPGQETLPFGNYVGRQTGQLAQCRSFLLFPLDGLPAQAQVQSAVLELYVDDWPFAGSGDMGVYRVQASWTEPFTWTVQPPTDSSPIVTQRLTSTPGWTLWDITPLVQDWADGAPNYGLMLAAAPQPETEIGWAAAARGRLNEGDPGLLPRLTITYRPFQPPAETPPVVPEASTLLLLGGAVSTLSLYIGRQLHARRS